MPPTSPTSGDELPGSAPALDLTTAVPVSLQTEYRELSLKLEHLRSNLAQAKAELASLKAKGPAT